MVNVWELPPVQAGCRCSQAWPGADWNRGHRACFQHHGVAERKPAQPVVSEKIHKLTMVHQALRDPEVLFWWDALPELQLEMKTALAVKTAAVAATVAGAVTVLGAVAVKN